MSENIDAFLRVLDGKDTKTGGGTASSIAGAMAAGLVSMVARLSIGKQDLLDREHYEEIARKADNTGRDLFRGGFEDSAAFDRISSAFKLPKNTPEEKAARSKELQAAFIQAAEVPLCNAASCRAILELCSRLGERFNTNAASDLECARYLAEAGMRGCAANVRINMPSIKNKEIRRDLELRLTEIIDREVAK